MTWQEYEDGLHADLEAGGSRSQDPDFPLLLSEVRMGCTMAMLLCLSPEQRLAYIFGEILSSAARNPAISWVSPLRITANGFLGLGTG
jgi:hypothetical protein